MVSALVQKLGSERNLKKILETTVKDLGEQFRAETCQVMLTNPLDPNVTSICEFRASRDEPQELLPTITIPLVLHGRTMGSLSVARYGDMPVDDINNMRSILGELSDIIRGAQVADIVQRDTTRDTFLVEIGNFMAYSLGIGDALFMVVNILGKMLGASRCLFICTDDTQAGWKCYEHWQQERVPSCQDYHWPTRDSSLIAQVLLSQEPLRVYEGQANSYISPVQDELQVIGVKSLLGIPLRSADATHGCVILQQCDYRRAWTRQEVDIVQNVADKIADALVKLPAEKRAREPIMQLHQRIVTEGGDAGQKAQQSQVSVRNALKGAMGQQAIPTAMKTSERAAPPQAKPTPQPPRPTAAATTSQALAQAPWPAVPGATPGQANTASTQMPVQPGVPGEPQIGVNKGLGNVLNARTQSQTQMPQVPSNENLASPGGAYADLDLSQKGDAGPNDTWGRLDTIPTPSPELKAGTSGGALTAPPPPPAPTEPTAPATAPASGANLAGLDSIPTPKISPAKAWGDLDSIPTPGGSSAPPPPRGGLTGMMSGKARAGSTSKPFGKARQQATPPPAEPGTVSPPAEPITEAAAEAKLKAALAANTSEDIGDYIFTVPGLDPRMAGRVSGWIQEIETKDRYVGGHAKQVAEIAVAIAKEAGLSAQEVDTVRLAGLLHDVGKRACPPEVLQKKDEDLSDPELIIMMKHPIDGADLLESFAELKHLADIVRAHHEEFDGNGYPAGLKGNEIPVPARIVALANSYHSMVSPMCYGPGMAPTKAQEELVKGAGKQWDPMYVQYLIQAIMSKKLVAV